MCCERGERYDDIVVYDFILRYIWKTNRICIQGSWNIMKVMLYIVFLPAILMIMLFGGLIYIALPILVIVGLVSLFCCA